MGWSKIWYKGHPFYDKIVESMGSLTYHNVEHVQSMYDFYEKHSVPYNKPLDMATAFHDSVFDAFPDKEERSVEFLYEVAGKTETSAEAATAIMYTTSHALPPFYDAVVSPLVAADLSNLCNPHTAVSSYSKIVHENWYLHDMTERDTAEKTIKYMLKLLDVVDHNNRVQDTGPIPENYWEQVRIGIKAVMHQCLEQL